MSFGYRLLYRLGLTPWERDEPPDELVALVDGPKAPAPGRALDVGCGDGRDAVFLAQRGWRVTGVDFAPRALATARRRGAEAGVDVEWIRADVSRLAEAGIEPGFRLVYDRGCFHGLPEDQRSDCARALTALAGPEATLLLMGFVPGHRGPAPAGVSRQELARRFGDGWELLSAERASGPGPRWPLRDAQPTWYRFRRRP